MSRERVVAVTVTFNRIETLKKNLEALTAQTCPLEKILVVDNGSSPECRRQLEELERQNPLVRVLWLQENLGGAGGFEAGMRFAAGEYRPDWYWIMDDDAYPRPDTLERLLDKKGLPDIGCLAPLIWGVDWQEYQYYHHKKTSACFTKDVAKFSDVGQMREVEEIDADAFVGPLFPAEIVEEAGYPDGGLFIYGDDTEYTLRIGRRHRLYLVRDAVIDHNDPPRSGAGFGPGTYWKLYYTIRNRVLLVKKYNSGFRKAAGLFLLTGNMLWQMAYSLLRRGLGRQRYVRMRCVLKGYFDGLAGRKGKTIDPEEFQRQLR